MLATFWAWITGRGLQLLSGPLGWGLLAFTILSAVGIGYYEWKASIVDGAIAGRDLQWSTKVNDATRAAEQAERNRQDAMNKAADAQRKAEQAKNNLDIARGQVITLEQKIKTLTAKGQRTLCIPKDYPR